MTHPCHIVTANNAEVVRLVQLTDSHLGEEAGAALLGMDTDHSLQAVIDLVQKERSGIDLLLGTGDLSDMGAQSAYARLEKYFAQFSCDSVWLPGNHDMLAAMQAEAGAPSRLCKEVRIANWQIILLDSQVPGEVGGQLGEAELKVLEAGLTAAGEAGLHTLVCLHHQPVEIGCEWLDEQMVADADAFFSVLERFASVRAVLWGHVHQEIDRMRGDIQLLGSPSTCVQFAPNHVDFQADDLPPGYRWLDLHADGTLETGVSRVWDVPFNVDLNRGGYL